MKAKAFHNKLLAIVLTVVLVALSVPTAIFMVGASGEVPTVDATTDIGKYVNFYQDKNLFKEYDETGSLKLSSSNILTTYGDNYTAGGTYYASVKMTFDPDFEFKYSVNSETGKWEKKGVSYGQNGFVIGTMTDGTTTKNVTVAYRHGQGVFYLFNDDTSFSKGLGGGATAGLNEVTVTVKYDAATGLLSTWFNGTQGNDVDTTTLKDGWTFTFGGFDLRTMGGGSRPADKEDGTNEETVTNSMTFSDLHIWGDVTTTKHYMAPSIGSATNIANTLTLSDSALNTDWKDDGAFTWNFTNATFNGIDFAENTIVYASVTMSGIKKGNGGSDIFGVAFAKDGDSYAYNYLRPQWNQQGVSGSGNISLTSTDGWGVAGSDGSLASWDTQDQVFIYKYDVNEKTVEVWRRTAVYQSYWGSVWAASYQDIYVGKFSINSPAAMVLGIYTSPSADVATFQGQPTVKDVKVWVEESSAPTPPPSDEEPEEGAFTLSDAVLNAQYAESGEIVIDSTTGTVFINGINVVPGIGQKIIYSFDKQYSRAPYDDLVTYGKINPVMVYAAKTDGTIAGYGPNPGWNQTSHVGGLTLAGSVLGSTGSYNKGTSAKETYKVVYDVDTGKVELWANTERIAGYHANGELLMATATLDNGFAFKPGISGNEITGGTATISNIKVEYSSTSSIDTTNKVGNFVAYEGGFLDTGIKYDNSTDLGVSNTPKWEEGTTVNNTGIFTSLKQGGYDGKKTIVWKGNRTGDLTKGAIIYQADFTIYNKTTGWNGTNWGFVVAKVDGHYVSTGFGIHGAAGAAYKNTTVIDGSNIGEQASANTAFLGASCNGSYSVAGTEDGVTVTLTAVLTSTSLTTYINGVKGQTFDFTGKTVEPMFAFAWGSGNANDKITNVKFMGDGIVEIPCEHSYSYDCDTKCDLCGEEREIEDYLHQYKSACALKCMYCGVERLHAPDDHSYSNACDPTCNNCDETRTVDPSLHNYTSDCDAFCDNCNYERTLDASVQHTYSDNCDITCNLCGAERTPPHTYSSDCDAECDGCGASRTPLGNHTFDGPQDAFCNGCGAERIAINTLKKNGELTNVFKDQLAASTPLIGVSLDMNPAQFATQSISLGGAIFDISKGYTISADFTVKTNASMESHFGITAVVINNDIYTFGMLSNGNWSTNTPTQQYVPYARKNNGNTLVSASGSNVTATDEGATVNLKVVVTASSATYYINNVEALTIDLTGKTILPYAAFTSRGANVTVSNIEFFGAGVKNHATHDFDSACDAVCDTCYAVRVAADHQYDDETCDVDCNVCGSKREVTHKYSFVCDDVCDVCGTKRDVTHTFTDNCDETCDVDGCTATRKAPHSYENDCDKDCDLCGATRFVSKHVYDDNNDLECNVCGYKRPAYDFSGMADHTDEMYLNNKEYRDNFAGNGKFTMTDGITTSDNALIAKNNGKVVVSANIKFNGNVDFNWLDTNNDGEYKYENAWGKTGIKIGTYFEVDDNLTRSVYVSFRRCSAHAYLFNEGNKVLGDFGAAGAMTAENIKLTALYDVDTKEVHLWADDIYVGMASVANLKDFKFNIGFVTQGLGTSAVDKDDVTNGETTKNSVTISDIKVLGDVKVDPNFELPAVEHTHEYDNDKDLICNTCGAEKINFAPLKNTTGKLQVLFEDQLKSGAPATGTAFDLNPNQFATHSLLLGGAKYDFTKGGYTISADFYVKTNSSMESHFGITALVINNEPYTFGMLSNGNWNTPDGNVPTQKYVPYLRKNNGNEIISAGGSSLDTTETGTKVNLFVDVNDSRVIFYINGTEAYSIDLTGKTVAPYAALTSRGANVTVKNVQFNGKGVTNCTEHKYSGACDAICDICYGGVRKATPHVYDNDTCDTNCNECGSIREVTHVYVHDCDNKCSACGNDIIPKASHTYDDDCDEICNVCEATRTAPHSYENDCDKDCNLCGKTRFVNKHVYDDEADLQCNVCGYKRPAYKFDGMADHTEEMFLNNKGHRDDFAGKGKFTMTDGITTSDNALIAKNKGKVVVSANIKFNGNVDFNWLDTNKDGEYKYENAWGKTGIKIGTYFEVDDNLTRSVYVSFRRCSAHAYLFNEGNKILGDFGAAGAMTAKNIKLTVLYDIKSGEVHLWADDIYVGVASVANLKDFKFNIGFVTQGLGTSAVDKDDVTNGETKPNSVTISDIKVLGDVKVDPNFELPAVEHTHEYDNDKDLICNTCGAEKIKFAPLKNTTGKLEVLFEDQLKNATAVTSNSYSLNPGAYSTHSILLGGAKYDFTKGGYTISADFYVKTNSSMESHFGITALVINNEPYTFGMLANGDWSTTPVSPIQVYTPYIRKNNGNELLSAGGNKVTATEKGAKVSLFVDVNDARAIFYINGTEARMIDLTGKTVAPYAALTSRGANVTVKNVQFNGKGVTNCTEHKYSGACDAICDICYGGFRKAKAHTYDDKTCDTDCNECGSIREVTHVYTHDCDTKCSACGKNITPKAPHTYDDDCDEICNVCEATRTAPHSYTNDCDTVCDLCEKTRFVNKHVYDDEADLQCNVCGYKRPAYKFDGMADHTEEMFLNNKEYRDNFAGKGKFTMTDGITTSDNALIAKNKGKVVVSANIKFNGNVDFNWLDTNKDGEYKYENAWGKTGIKIGTYFDVDDNLTRSVYVSFRRCSAHAYLFNEGNKILGDFGAAGAMTAKNIKLTVLYDIKSGEVHLWADDIYVGVASVANLKDFKFNIGFVTQGLGTSAVDKDDVTNGETKPNTVTISNIKVLGDVKVDPNFELPAVEHTHEYDNDKDLICNTCGAEKIKFAPLKNTTGKLEVFFEEQLKNGAQTTGTSFDLKPNQFATHSLLLGGAKYDFTKGGYTISADFYVKTNSSMESHFGITALVINNEPYTFGMLSNGNWNTPDGNVPTQKYVPYARKNNGNDLIGATGPSVEATEKGAKVNLFVDVNDARAIFYINGTEALKIDLTGKTVAPYAALTSRGANVTVKNVQFNGKGVTNCTEHKYSGACDAICDICYGGFRKAKAHTYDDKTCDKDCNVCGSLREVSHVREHDCDTKCTKCGAAITQNAPHKYKNDCDDTCDVCEAKRTAPHVYDHDCDTKCNECGYTRYVNKHIYDDDNDLECNRCGYIRPAYPSIKGMKNHTSKYHINQNDYRKELEKTGKFTIKGDMATTGGGLLAKDSGQIVITADMKFNGNVDFFWRDVNEDGEYKYENGWGKVGIKIGTYFDTDSNTTQNVYVSFRRCSAHVYLFNDGNKVLGDFGPAGAMTAETLSMVILYDIDKQEVSLWADGKYVNTCTLKNLEKFNFNTGFVTQGIGTSAVDAEDVTNKENTQNSVTFSNFKVLGDLKKDPDFVAQNVVVSPPAGSLPLPNSKDFKDFTNDFHLDDGKLDKNLTSNGNFTISGGNTAVSGAGVLFKPNGNGYVSVLMKFNGNVDFNWTEKKVENKKGEMVGTGEYEYTNGWGKYGIKIGTYTRVIKDADGNVTGEQPNQPVYVSYRRCTSSAYLFDAGNNVLGGFGSYGSSSCEEIRMTVMYDSENMMVYLWLDDYFVKALPVSHLKDFDTSLGFIIQGTGSSAVEPNNPKNPATTPNSVTFSDVKVFGDFEKDPNFYIPELEPMKDNLAKYIELRSGSNTAAYFDRMFRGVPGTNYSFTGLKYDSSNAIYNVSFDYVLTERSKDKEGKEVSWGSIRFGVMEAAGYSYQLSTLPSSLQLLANGGGYAGYSAPGSAQASKVGDKHNIAIQYNYKKNHMSVWFDGELVIRAAELPETNNEGRKILFSVLFEACSAEISDLKIWGTGLTVEVSEEYMALMNDPFYTSTTIPAKPEGNINYWTYISASNQSGDLAFDMINDEFANYWSDEQGRIVFRDSYGKRNLNGITNSTTFVAKFKYKVTEEDPDYVDANKQRGSVFTVRGYNLPTSQGKKNNYEIGFYNNAITVTTYRDSSAVSTTSNPWTREVGKEYEIAIVSAPNWVKVFVDGKLVTAIGGLYQYTFDFCYESVHVCAEFWDMQVYNVSPKEEKEPIKNSVPAAQLTGATVNTIEHTNVPLATGTMSIWMIVTLLVAVLCLAGAAVITVVFIKKKKQNQ